MDYEALLVHELKEWREDEREGLPPGVTISPEVVSQQVGSVFRELMDTFRYRSCNADTGLTYMLAVPLRACTCESHMKTELDNIRRFKFPSNDVLSMVMCYFTVTEEALLSRVSQQFNLVYETRWFLIKSRLTKAMGMTTESINMWLATMGEAGNSMKDLMQFLRIQGMKDHAEDQWVYQAPVPLNKAQRARHLLRKRARYNKDKETLADIECNQS